MKPACKLGLEEPIDISSMSDEEKEAYVQAVVALANANKDALSSMDAGLPISSMDQLEQAASTLSDGLISSSAWAVVATTAGRSAATRIVGTAIRIARPSRRSAGIRPE